MTRPQSLIAAEFEKLSQQARTILLSARFNGANWTSCTTTLDIVEELARAKAAVTFEGGLKITGRGMIFRHLLNSVTYRSVPSDTV